MAVQKHDYVLPTGRYAGKRIVEVITDPIGRDWLQTHFRELRTAQAYNPGSLSTSDKQTLEALEFITTR